MVLQVVVGEAAVVQTEAGEVGETADLGQHVCAVQLIAADVEPLQVGEIVQVADERACEQVVAPEVDVGATL